MCGGHCLRFAPSALAAAALYTARLRHGVLPLWPTALAQLTGAAPDQPDGDLMAAIAALSG